MEEFLKQADDFGYSLWGGLFFFIGGLLMTVIMPLSLYKEGKIWFSILWFFPGAFLSVRLFFYQHTLFGSLLAVIVLVVGVVIIIVEIRKRIKTFMP